MSAEYDKDKYLGRIHGKPKLRIGTSGSSGFVPNGTGNAISASYFFGDGSGLVGISHGSGDGEGSGGTTFNYWMVDAPPGTANSLDDEFSGSLSGWSTFDPGSSGITSTTTNNRLVLNQGTFSGDKNAGLFKNAPTASSGDYQYAFWTKASWVSADATNFPICYIFIAEDAAGDPNNTDLWNIGIIRESNSFRTHAQGWSNYSSYNAGENRVEYIYSQSSYLRIRVSYAASSNTTTYGFDKSDNGEGWFQVTSRTYTGHLKHIGLGINNVQGSTEFYGLFDFFRVYDSADFFFFPSGSNVQITKTS